MENLDPSSSRGNRKVEMSPPQKIKEHDLSDREKFMIVNFYKYVMMEQQKGDNVLSEKEIFEKPNMEYIKKAAEALGMPKTVVLAVLEEKKDKYSELPSKRKVAEKIHYKLDESDLEIIRRKVHQFYLENEGPTVDKVLKSINEGDDLPDLSKKTLCNFLKRLTFTYMTKNRDCLMEEDFNYCRNNYLTMVQQYRKEGKYIYYLDETWIDADYTGKKAWQWQDDETASTEQDKAEKEKMLVIGHIGSEEGFVDGGLLILENKKNKKYYHDIMKVEQFEEWIKGVLPKLKKDSVLVLDMAGYHSRPSEEIPDELSSKIKIQEWLKSKNIHFEPDFFRVQLLDLVEKEKTKTGPKFAVDDLAAEHSITILRMPLYHSELNPLQLIFSQVKEHVAKNNKTFKIQDVKTLFEEGLAQMTKETWKKCIDHVVDVEKKMCQLESIIDDVTDRFATGESETDISLYTYSDEYSEEDDEYVDEEEGDSAFSNSSWEDV